VAWFDRSLYRQDMPRRIAERLRDIAIKCDRLARTTTDKTTANELEGMAAELAQKAQKLDELFKLIEEVA
jgi:hypothetical protein